MTPERRALEAHELLQNTMLTEALATLKTIYIESGLRRCDAKDDLGRFRYTVALDVVDGVTRHLEAVLAAGKLSAQQAREFQTDTIKNKITRIF